MIFAQPYTMLPAWNGVGSHLPKPNEMRTTMKASLAVFAVAGSLALASCGDSAAKQAAEAEKQAAAVQAKADSTRKAFEADYKLVMSDLSTVRDSINKKLSSLDAELAAMKPKDKARAAKEALKAEVEREKTVVNDAIAKVDDATESTWGDFKAETHDAAQKAKDWWAGLKDFKAPDAKANGGH